MVLIERLEHLEPQTSMVTWYDQLLFGKRTNISVEAIRSSGRIVRRTDIADPGLEFVLVV